MKKILITGAGSFIGTSFEKYVSQWSEQYQVDTVDMSVRSRKYFVEHFDKTMLMDWMDKELESYL